MDVLRSQGEAQARAFEKGTLLDKGRGYDPLALMALLGGGDPGMQEALKEAMSSKNEAEKLEMQKGFQEQFVELQKAVQDRNWELLNLMVSQSFSSMGAAIGARVGESEGKAEGMREMASLAARTAPQARICAKCGTAYLVDPCPKCG